MIGRLGYGELRVRSGNDTKRYYVDGGFVQVADNVVSVLTNRAVPAAMLDAAAVTEQLRAAQSPPRRRQRRPRHPRAPHLPSPRPTPRRRWPADQVSRSHHSSAIGWRFAPSALGRTPAITSTLFPAAFVRRSVGCQCSVRVLPTYDFTTPTAFFTFSPCLPPLHVSLSFATSPATKWRRHEQSSKVAPAGDAKQVPKPR